MLHKTVFVFFWEIGSGHAIYLLGNNLVESTYYRPHLQLFAFTLHIFSGQLLFASRAGRHQLQKNYVQTIEAVIPNYILNMFIADDHSILQIGTYSHHKVTNPGTQMVNLNGKVCSKLPEYPLNKIQYSTGIYFNESVIVCGGNQKIDRKLPNGSMLGSMSSDMCYILQVSIKVICDLRALVGGGKLCIAPAPPPPKKTQRIC